MSSWLGGGWAARSINRYLRTQLHVPQLNQIQRMAADGKKFVFAVHPHSMFGISTLVHFALNRLLTRELLGSDIDFRVCTINMNFFIPFVREYLMSRGFVCADSSTFSTLLQKGISPVIVPGGAEETLYAYPGSADLVVQKRFGFVREALLNGAWLVPIYCFGDNEAVPVFRNKAVVKFQRCIQKWLTFATPLTIPFFTRVPIHMVMGAPLPPPTSGSPESRLQLYHAQYLDALQALFKSNVSRFGTPAEKRGKGLRFVK